MISSETNAPFIKSDIVYIRHSLGKKGAIFSIKALILIYRKIRNNSHEF